MKHSLSYLVFYFSVIFLWIIFQCKTVQPAIFIKSKCDSNSKFIINFPDTVDNAKANEGWAKLQQIVEDYKKDHNGASVYAPSFIEDCEPAVKKLQEEYGFEYTVEYVK